MPESSATEATITFNQDGVRGFAAALICAQTYEIFIDQQKVTELNGYTHRKSCTVQAGTHSIYARAYARDSVGVSRVYGYSQTLELSLAAGDHALLSCGLLAGPPVRKYLIFGGLAITLGFALGLGPVGSLSLQTRYTLVMIASLITIACGWIGYSSRPGTNIYLKRV